MHSYPKDNALSHTTRVVLTLRASMPRRPASLGFGIGQCVDRQNCAAQHPRVAVGIAPGQTPEPSSKAGPPPLQACQSEARHRGAAQRGDTARRGRGLRASAAAVLQVSVHPLGDPAKALRQAVAGEGAAGLHVPIVGGDLLEGEGLRQLEHPHRVLQVLHTTATQLAPNTKTALPINAVPARCTAAHSWDRATSDTGTACGHRG